MTVSATDVADFFKQNPDFLVRNPGVLAFVQLPNQASGNVTSLQERQVQTMREKVRKLEHRIVELSRAAVENQAIINNLLTLQRELLRVREFKNLPQTLIAQISKSFNVPMVKLTVWSEAASHVEPRFRVALSEGSKAQLNALREPFCGFSESAPAFEMFDDEEVKPRSVVIMALRVGAEPAVFGCLALGSPDKDRFSPSLEKDLLNSLSETACAALTRLT